MLNISEHESEEVFFNQRYSAYKFAESLFTDKITLIKELEDDTKLILHLKLNEVYKQNEEIVGEYDIVDTRLIKIEKEIQEEVKEEGKPYIPYKETEKEVELKRGFDVFINDEEPDFRIFPIFDKSKDFKIKNEFLIKEPIELKNNRYGTSKKVTKVYAKITVHTVIVKCMDD